MRKFAITALASLAAGVMLTGTAQAQSPGNVWVSGEAVGTEFYIVTVAAEGEVGHVKLNLQSSFGQTIEGVRNGNSVCQIALFGATCDLYTGAFPQNFAVTVKRYAPKSGPFHLKVQAIAQETERDYTDNYTDIETI